MNVDLSFLGDATWLNPPPAWSRDAAGLAITTGFETDFWRNTFYGFERDNGHFFGTVVKGDFTATAIFEGVYETLYDQAGLMLRLDERNWLKLGIEFSGGVTNFSVVATRGRSDWSMVSAPLAAGPQAIRLTRVGGAALAHFRDAATNWHLMRVADFPEASPAQLGPMACSPQRAGFQVRFTTFSVGPAISSPLHPAQDG